MNYCLMFQKVPNICSCQTHRTLHSSACVASVYWEPNGHFKKSLCFATHSCFGMLALQVVQKYSSDYGEPKGQIFFPQESLDRKQTGKTAYVVKDLPFWLFLLQKQSSPSALQLPPCCHQREKRIPGISGLPGYFWNRFRNICCMEKRLSLCDKHG